MHRALGIALDLDQYIKDAIEHHQSFAKKPLRQKFTPIQPGNNLSASDYPITPDPSLQTHYRSMVATLQFAATWVRFDIAYAVSYLVQFCASAGPTHHADLHHLMEYLVRYPSFKLDSGNIARRAATSIVSATRIGRRATRAVRPQHSSSVTLELLFNGRRG
jgi:hypothetical protein